MKRIAFMVCCCVFGTVARSQDADAGTERPGVEKSMFGVQLSVLSLWAYHEMRLKHDALAWRSELGSLFFLRGASGTRTSVGVVPVVGVGPRWYYNLSRRAARSRDVRHNSGNFMALRVRYFYNISILVLPTWGIRRNLGRHFGYEAGLGVGYSVLINLSESRILRLNYQNIPGTNILVQPYVRIGYRF